MSLVSVILAVYNGEKYIEAAIESILEQTYTPIEILVINDGSKDDTEKTIQKYLPKIRYFSRPHQGQPAAQNFGISISTGSFLSFLDADDLHMPEKTFLQLQFLENKPEVDAVFGHVEQFFSPELSSIQKKQWIFPSGISPGYFASAALFRKKCFKTVGLFNEQQHIGVFIDWYMRSTEKGIISDVIPEKVLQRRIHENNMGISCKNSHLEYIKVVQNALKRRRHETR